MVEFTVKNWKYGYFHDNQWPAEAVDSHHVIVLGGKNWVDTSISCIFLAAALANAFCLSQLKDKFIILVLWSFLLISFAAKLLRRKSIVKESVVIMPSFGVQLESHYMSGKVLHRFVPIDQILKPLLQECVSPVTCYWCLSLIIRDETELMLVFKELHPPIKMLVPIWKALCAASLSGEDTNHSPCGSSRSVHRD